MNNISFLGCCRPRFALLITSTLSKGASGFERSRRRVTIYAPLSSITGSSGLQSISPFCRCTLRALPPILGAINFINHDLQHAGAGHDAAQDAAVSCGRSW